MTEPNIAWDLAADLGEGPVWVERDAALWFTDIKKKKLHRLDPAGERRSWDAPEQVGFILPAAGGGFVVGLQSGLHHFDETSGSFALVAAVDSDKPDNRLNDAVTDPLGRIWFGTMNDGEREASGAFYRFDRGKVVPTGLDRIAITNGPAVSPDGRILYFVDTLAGTIEAADIAQDGSLSGRRPFVRIDPREGHPDGPSVDCEGCVWIALYGGWEARRYSPAGEVVRRVRFPVANITKVAFGGPGLRTGYATTARHLLRPEQLEKQPHAGALFAFEIDVPGIPCPAAILE